MAASQETLSPREEKFCLEYVANGGNGTQAAKDAGYAASGAHVQAHKLSKRPRVQARILEIRELAAAKALEVMDKREADLQAREAAVARLEGADAAAERLVDRVRERLAAIALAPLTSLMEWGPDGARPIPSRELTPEAAASVAKVKVKVKEAIKEQADGTGEAMVLFRDTEFELAQHNPIAAARELLELLGVKQADPRDKPGAGVAIFVVGGPTGLERIGPGEPPPMAGPVAVVEAHSQGAAPLESVQGAPATATPRPWNPGKRRPGGAIVVAPTP